jgi:hypothetical protein
MDHQLAVLKRGPQNLKRKPSEYLRSIYMLDSARFSPG